MARITRRSFTLAAAALSASLAAAGPAFGFTGTPLNTGKVCRGARRQARNRS